MFSVLDVAVLKSSSVFDCGHSDLNDFFSTDCIAYSKELLGKSYCFRLDADPFRSYPAVLIGRLGVNQNLKGAGIGRELMDFIKSWFILTIHANLQNLSVSLISK